MGATQRLRLMDGSLIWADSLQIRQQKKKKRGTRQTIKVLTSRRTAQMINTTICGRENNNCVSRTARKALTLERLTKEPDRGTFLSFSDFLKNLILI